MLKHLNLLCLQFKLRKWVLDYGKTEWYCGITNFLSLSNITLFVKYHLLTFFSSIISSLTILKFLQGFLKLAFFSHYLSYNFRIKFTSNKVSYFSQFNVFACHLSKIQFQLERIAWFYLPLNFWFFISRTFDFLFRREGVSWKQLLLNFLFCWSRYFYCLPSF